MRRRTVMLLAGAVTAALAAGAALWFVRARSVAFFTDADTIRRPVDGTDPRDILWRPAQALPPAVNTAAEEYEPRVSADGTLLFFVRGKAGANAELFVAARTPDGWGPPTPLAGINSDADDLGPEPSSDGTRLYFYSNRPGGAGGYDLWYADRAADGWRDPVNLGPTVNTGFNEYGPALTPGDATLYFSSNRPRPDAPPDPGADAWPATVREDLYRSDYDLYLAPVTDRGFGVPQPLVVLNSTFNDGAPAVSPVGDFVYFASDRPGGAGGFDLYRSRRLRGAHRPPSNLGPSVNSDANELDPGVGLGGFGLHFSSDRAADAAPDGRRDYDLFRTTSREVFTETDVVRSQIDWASLLPLLWWALLALLTALLLWLLTRLMRSERFGRLGLLARCLLASMLVHLLLMILLAFWGVGSSLSNWMQRSGGTRVTLLTRAADGDLATQLRGTLTTVAVDVPVPRTSSSVPELPITRDEPADIRVEVESTRPPAREPLPARPADEAPPPTATVTATPITSTVPASVPDTVVAVQLPPTATPQRTREQRPDATTPVLPRPTARTADPLPAPLDDLAATIELSIATTVAIPTPLMPAPDHAPPDALPPTPSSPAPGAGPRLAAPVELPRAPERPAERTAETPRRVHGRGADASRLESALEPTAAPRRDEVVALPPTITTHADDRPLSAATPAPVAAPAPAFRTAPARDRPLPPAASMLALPTMPAPTAVTRVESGANLRLPEPAAGPTDVDVPVTPRRVEPPVDTAGAIGRAALIADPIPAPLPADARVRVGGRTPTALAPRIDRAAPLDVALPEAGRPASTPTPERTASRPLVVSRAGRVAIDVRSGAPRTPRPAETDLDRLTPTITAAASLVERSPDPIDTPIRERETRDPLALTAVPTAPVHLDLPTLPSAAPAAPTPPVPPPPPPAVVAAPNPQTQRAPERRRELVERLGGSVETEEAVGAALAWLARHQSDDGRWDGVRFDDGCGQCGDPTKMPVDIALTGLSLLSFLAADHTHVRDGPYRSVVADGLAWLLAQQEADGSILRVESMYSHGIASIALAEAYGMTGDPTLREPVRRAIDFIVEARDPRGGGWRYAPRQAGDTSVTGWQVMALVSAQKAGVTPSDGGFASARRWLERVSTPALPGLYAYRPGQTPTPAMTAEGMFVQQLLGHTRDEPMMRASADYLLAHPPRWDDGANTYAWYYATLALFQHQGLAWSRWNDAVRDELVAHQAVTGPAAGSWQPVDQWSRTGGRVYQTAICTLTLEVYYRYLPRYLAEGTEPTEGPPSERR